MNDNKALEQKYSKENKKLKNKQQLPGLKGEYNSLNVIIRLFKILWSPVVLLIISVTMRLWRKRTWGEDLECDQSQLQYNKHFYNKVNSVKHNTILK